MKKNILGMGILTLALSISLSLLATPNVSAASFNQREQSDLKTALDNTVKISWRCSADGNPNAVLVIQVNNSASSLRCSDYLLVIQDQQVAEALGFPYYPAVLSASGDDNNIRATEGFAEPTAEFSSELGGMKLVAISNGTTEEVLWDNNWFFQASDCVKN